MRIMTLIGITLSLLATALEARDQVPREKKSSLTAIEYNPLDHTIMSDSQQYAPNLGGLRQYLDQELTTDSREYGRLNARLQELEKQDQFAFRASLLPFGLGAGSLLVGAMLAQDEEPTDAQLKRVHEKGERLMLYGVGGLAFGFLLNSMLAPDESDVKEFIRFHNGRAGQAVSGRKAASSYRIQLLSENTLLSFQYKF
jgi:hypothetical protein